MKKILVLFCAMFFGFASDFIPLDRLETISQKVVDRNFGSYHFVGLDSGEKDAIYGFPGCMMGKGLTNSQINWLQNDLAENVGSTKTFIFMHHTALDPDECPDFPYLISSNKIYVCSLYTVELAGIRNSGTCTGSRRRTTPRSGTCPRKKKEDCSE